VAGSFEKTNEPPGAIRSFLISLIALASQERQL
jgi:hypothetical protein